MNICLVLHKYSVSLADPCCYPLGYMYISAVLKQAGHNVKVLNYNLFDYDFEQEIQGFDVVGFTGFEEFLPYIKHDAAICKAKGIKTILGGALATFKADEMLQYVDTVILGEGEAVINQALNAFGKVQGNKSDINKLPLPDYESFGIAEYNNRHSIKYMGVLTSRGCPYSCRFCAHTCAFQVRSLFSVFDEIDAYMERYGAEYIVFNDNTFNISKPRFLKICNGMKERGLSWSAAIRVDVFDEEMAAAAKDSGCKYFVVGVESFKQCKLDRMNKMIRVEQIYKTLDLLHKYGIGYHGNILTGLPGESFEDIVAELEAMPKQYNVYPVLVQPFIGTAYQKRSINGLETECLADFYRQNVAAGGLSMYRGAA